MTRPLFWALFAATILPPMVQAQNINAENEETDFRTDSAASTGTAPDDNSNSYFQTESEAVNVPMLGDSTSPPGQGKASSSLPARQDDVDALRERVEMLEEDIERLLGEQDRLKAESALDRLNWSGSYRFDLNLFHLNEQWTTEDLSYLEMVVGPTGSPVIGDDGIPEMRPVTVTNERDRNEWLSPSWTHRLKLAMSYDFGESLRFYSQLGVYKYFNETLNTVGAIDHGSNAYPRDNAFRLERVYFDWFITKWLALSVGRIASPDGPPTELKENADRRSGWGVQMVNATIDTVMTTFYLAENTYLRLFYSPFGLHSSYSPNSPTSLLDNNGINLMHSWGGLFEFGIPSTKESIFQLGLLHIPQFTPQNTKIKFPWNEDVISPDEPTGNDLGMYMGVNTLLLLKNIFNSGLDLFAAYGLTILNPANDYIVYHIPIEIHHPDSGFTGRMVDIESEVGLASNAEEGVGSINFGHIVYAGFRYTLPVNAQYPTRLGGEFNLGTKYHLAWSHPNDQLLDKLGLKGMAFEGYLIQQIVPKHLFARIGYIELKRNYTGAFIGPTNKVDQRIRNLYFLVDLAW